LNHLTKSLQLSHPQQKSKQGTKEMALWCAQETWIFVSQGWATGSHRAQSPTR